MRVNPGYCMRVNPWNGVGVDARNGMRVYAWYCMGIDPRNCVGVYSGYR